MAEYVRLSLVVDHSQVADYVPPEQRQAMTTELTPDKVFHSRLLCATGGTTVTTSGLTSVTAFIVHNRDATNYVDVTWTSAANGATPNIARIIAGAAPLQVTDLTVASNIVVTADTLACICDVWVFGT